MRKPYFVTAYLTALDHEQHAEGPGTEKAHAVLERIDAIVGKLVATQLVAHPDGTIAIVSDHGFEAISRETNFFRAFLDAGLIRLDDAGKVSSWEAMPWPSGGSVAIVLADRRPTADALQLLAATYDASPASEELARVMDIDIALFLVDDMLVKTDRSSMANSLEVRVPILDTVVAELALSLPSKHKVKGLTKKRLLKMAVEPLVPAEIIKGEKRGFAIVPLDELTPGYIDLLEGEARSGFPMHLRVIMRKWL